MEYVDPDGAEDGRSLPEATRPSTRYGVKSLGLELAGDPLISPKFDSRLAVDVLPHEGADDGESGK